MSIGPNDQRNWLDQITPELRDRVRQSREERENLRNEFEQKLVTDQKTGKVGRFVRYEGVFPRVHAVYQTDEGEEFFLSSAE